RWSCHFIADRFAVGGFPHDAFLASLAAPQYGAAAHDENLPHPYTPAVLRAATAGAGRPYRLERAHGPEQRRQWCRLLAGCNRGRAERRYGCLRSEPDE